MFSSSLTEITREQQCAKRERPTPMCPFPGSGLILRQDTHGWVLTPPTRRGPGLVLHHPVEAARMAQGTWFLALQVKTDVLCILKHTPRCPQNRRKWKTPSNVLKPLPAKWGLQVQQQTVEQDTFVTSDNSTAQLNLLPCFLSQSPTL